MDILKTAVFAGSFDPITLGHVAIVRRATALADKVIVAVGNNSDKKYMFPIEERLLRVQKAFASIECVECRAYDGLTIDLCRKCGAQILLRGVRSTLDFEYERQVAEVNRLLAPDIETVLLIADPSTATISSTMVRELLLHGKDVSNLIP